MNSAQRHSWQIPALLVALMLIVAACSPVTAPNPAPNTNLQPTGPALVGTPEANSTALSYLGGTPLPAVTPVPGGGTGVPGTTVQGNDTGPEATAAAQAMASAVAGGTSEASAASTVGTPEAAGTGTTALAGTPEAYSTALAYLGGTPLPAVTPAAGGGTSVPGTTVQGNDTGPEATAAAQAMATAVGGSSAAASTPGLLPQAGIGINNVTYTAVEYSFQGPDSIPGGWTQITLQNNGQKPHDLAIYKLAAGKTISDVMAALSGPGVPDWVQAYGGTNAAPGQSASYTVNLQPGNYVLLSLNQSDPNQPPDAARGMLKMVTVTQPQGNAGQATPPQAAVSINMVDYAFVVTGTLKSGPQTVYLTNSGTEMHEAVFMRLKPGKTMADFNAAMQADMSGTPTPPGQEPTEQPASMTTLSPGVSAYTTVNLQPGNWMLVCFIPSVKNGGKPHAELGMVRQITVQ